MLRNMNAPAAARQTNSALPTKKIARPTVSAGLGVPHAPQPKHLMASVLTGFPHSRQGYMDMA
jgi:hypothetical protein